MDRDKEVDIYRDTPIRYLGYANEVGEAFRAHIGHKWVAATYGIASLYVLADTVDKASKVYKEKANDAKRLSKATVTAMDTLIWQMLASVVIPGFTINRLCAGTEYVIKKYSQVEKNKKRMIVTAVGLAAIPIIIHPIDHFVDMLMDRTFRKMFSS